MHEPSGWCVVSNIYDPMWSPFVSVRMGRERPSYCEHHTRVLATVPFQ